MTKQTIIKSQDGRDLAVVGKLRRHRFVGNDPVRCDHCGAQFSAIGHK